MSLSEILQIGDPRLRQSAHSVENPEGPAFKAEASRLKAALAAFRKARGFGRAIAAPQLGINQRFLALDLGEGPRAIINPEITARSEETFTLWDDCMSFPWLLVKLRRHTSVSLRFQDERGRLHQWDWMDPDVSELMQHELDHLDGILALDHALDAGSIVSRQTFARDPAFFRAQVDPYPKS